MLKNIACLLDMHLHGVTKQSRILKRNLSKLTHTCFTFIGQRYSKQIMADIKIESQMKAHSDNDKVNELSPMNKT